MATPAERKAESVLRKIYYSVGVSPLAYSQDAIAIARQAKKMAKESPDELNCKWFTVKTVKQFLKLQLPTQFFKPRRVNFRRTVYFSPGINRVWLADCGYLKHLTESKRDPAYFVLVYDIFSKMMYGRLVASTKSKDVALAFCQIVEEAGVSPESLGTDMGSEFQAQSWKEVMEKYKINHYFCQGSLNKAAPVERRVKFAMRTVKTLLHKMLDNRPDQNYKQLFQMCIWNINNRPNRSLPKGLTPSQINIGNESKCYEFMYGRSWKKMANCRFSFTLGQIVRIAKSNANRQFYKGHSPADQWSRELYRITKRFGTRPSTYQLSDWTSTPVLGRWYSVEMNEVPSGTEPTPYIASKVLGHRKQRGTGRPQLLVQLAQPGEKRYVRWIDEGLVKVLQNPNLKSSSEAKRLPDRMSSQLATRQNPSTKSKRSSVRLRSRQCDN